jgi:hypothetical protein
METGVEHQILDLEDEEEEEEEETEDDEDGDKEGKKNNSVRYLYGSLK